MLKRGQITIFIIVAVIMVAVVGLFLLLRSGIIPNPFIRAEKNPSAFLQNCLEDDVYEILEKISPQGGYLENPLNIEFKNIDEGIFYKTSYLCYTQAYNQKCVNQEPNLIQHIENEIQNHIEEKVRTCTDSLEESYSKAGYTVGVLDQGFEVDLNFNKIVIKIDKELKLGLGDDVSLIKGFEVNIDSNIYELIKTAQKIVNSEAVSCEFDYVQYMINNPNIEINYEQITSSGSEIYTIKDLKTQEWFRFAIRGCVLEWKNILS